MFSFKNCIKYISLPMMLVLLFAISYISISPSLNAIQKNDNYLSHYLNVDSSTDLGKEEIAIADIESNILDEEFSNYSHKYFGFIFNNQCLTLKWIYSFSVVPVFLDIVALPPR